jgi:tetratricopeptide (TPR) repeat protein
MTSKKLPVVGTGGEVSDDPFERLLSGDSAAVIDALRQHLEESPGDEVAWHKLGIAYMHIGHYADAATALAEAVEIDGRVVAARRLYARVLARLRRYDEATFQLVQAKRLAPDDAGVLHELGVAFYDKRLYDKALRELNRAAEIDPDDARIRFSIGLAHEGRGSMAEAIAAYRDTVRLDPGFVDARRTLADALAAMGEMADAVVQLQKALELDRTNTQVAMNLEVLQKGLDELQARRLLGKLEMDVEASALVVRGSMASMPAVDGAPRYGNELAQLWLWVARDGHITRLALVLPEPARAAAAADEAFRVEVVHHDGSKKSANYATAVTLTFLREALGCPMTRASAIYAELLASRQPVEWAGARISFDAVQLGSDQLHGVFVDATG